MPESIDEVCGSIGNKASIHVRVFRKLLTIDFTVYERPQLAVNHSVVDLNE